MLTRSILAAALAAALTTTAAAETRTMLVSGQSLAAAWAREEAPEAFRATRIRRGDRDTWNIRVVAYSNSAAMCEYADPRTPANCWVTGSTGLASYLLYEVVPGLKTWTVEPDTLLWIQGHREAKAINAGLSPWTRAVFVERYVRAVRKILKAQREALAGSAWTEIDAYVQVMGDQDDGGTTGEEWVREAQRTLVETYGTSDNISLGATEPRDLPLHDGTHPTPESYGTLGWLTARAIR